MNKYISEKRRIVSVFRLMRQMKGYGVKFFIGTIVHLIHKAAPIAIGFCTSLLVSFTLSNRVDSAKVFLGIVIFLVLFNAVLHYLDVLVSHDMAYRILADMRNMLFRRIDEIAPAAIEDKQSGDILSIVLEDIELLEWFFAHTLSQITVAIIIPLAGMIMLGLFHWSIPAIIAVFVVLLILVSALARRRSDEQGAIVREKLGKLNAYVVDGVQGIKDIISFRWFRQYYDRFFTSTKEYNDASLTYQISASGEGRMFQLLIGCGSLAAKVLIINLILTKKIDIQWLLPLFSLTSLIFIPLVDALNMSTNYGSIFAAADRVFDVLQIQPCVKDAGTGSSHSIFKQIGDNTINVEFRDINFRYPTRSKHPENPTLFNGLSFSFATGENVALVGASGSGKSTVARLLQRFWDPDLGQITMNGVDIRTLSLAALRELVSIVPQENYLFNTSIRENLLLSKPNATEDELIEACKTSQIHDFIRQLPNGYETVVGERGVRLSGGERQRLAIAQAVLKNSPILVLDEASANLDSENEHLVNEAINMLKEGRATLIIAHRVSTIRNADRIVLIDHGRVIEEGTFDQMLDSSTYFRSLIGVSDGN